MISFLLAFLIGYVSRIIYDCFVMDNHALGKVYKINANTKDGHGWRRCRFCGTERMHPPLWEGK